MYAFGDVKEPATDTVDVMEEILMEYLVDVVSNGDSYAAVHVPYDPLVSYRTLTNSQDANTDRRSQACTRQICGRKETGTT
jgi:Transcription initiation factor IID, 18kD subunit